MLNHTMMSRVCVLTGYVWLGCLIFFSFQVVEAKEKAREIPPARTAKRGGYSSELAQKEWIVPFRVDLLVLPWSAAQHPEKQHRGLDQE